VGVWRVCYIPIASNVSRETGVAVEVEQPEIAILSGSVASPLNPKHLSLAPETRNPNPKIPNPKPETRNTTS